MGFQTGGFPICSGKVLIVSRMFLLGAFNRPEKEEKYKSRKSLEDRENPEKIGKVPKIDLHRKQKSA